MPGDAKCETNSKTTTFCQTMEFIGRFEGEGGAAKEAVQFLLFSRGFRRK